MDSKRFTSGVRQLSRVLTLIMAATLSCAGWAQQVFSTPEQAAQSFVEALSMEPADPQHLSQLLGNDWRDFIPLEGVQRRDVDAFLTHYRVAHHLQRVGDHEARLTVGKPPDQWTLPIPIARAADGWRFDSKEGGEEIRARRIGRNELAAVQAVLAYHDAQMEYASEDRDGDGALEYAQKIFSTPGMHDGLYWAEDDSGQLSPLGPLFGETLAGEDWQGYHFRILDRQGPSAQGGAYGYLIDSRMSRGFALIAWPSSYGDTGVMSFMISHEGQVFEKDLGPDGDRQARLMAAFDPDDSWKEVSDEP